MFSPYFALAMTESTALNSDYMSHFDTNKYRVRYPKLGSKAYPRKETIELIAQFQSLGCSVGKRKLFGQRRISAEHNLALMESARLWNVLDRMEKQVKDRPGKGVA